MTQPMHANDLLNAVLAEIKPANVATPAREALMAFSGECLGFIKQRFPLHHERVGEPMSVGHGELGTDLAFLHELEIVVPFKHGYRASPQKVKEEVASALLQRYQGSQTTVREQRVAIRLSRSVEGAELQIDIVPGMERHPGSYAERSLDEDKKYLLLHDRDSACDRSCNFAKRMRLLRAQLQDYCDVVRLLRYWCHLHRFNIDSHALELLVYQASAAKGAPKTGSIEKLLRHVLQWATVFLSHDGILQDIAADYPWPDFLKPASKEQLAALWQRILAAIEHGDQSLLRSFFQ